MLIFILHRHLLSLRLILLALLKASRKFRVLFWSFLIPVVIGTFPVHGADYDKWSGRFSVELKAGSNEQIGTLDVLAPLWQQTDRLLFADVRLVDSSGPSIEGNLGLGFRKLEQNSSYFGGEWVWGIYGFYDRRHTASNNNFSQATVGAELYTDNWLLRGNYYNPESSGKTVDTRSGINETGLSGTEVILQQSPSLIAKEYALPGVDIEAGRRFDLSENQEFWLYAGYFNFDRSEAPEISGPRLRAEYRQYNAFDIAGSEFTIGVEFQDDDIRDSKEFFSLRLSIPFGESGSKKRQHTSSNIEQRMTEYVVRDKDIVSFAQDINKAVGSVGGPEISSGSSTIGSTPIVDPISGESLNVFIVSNTGGGDCSQASPCTLAVAQADTNYGAGDVIIVTNSDGVVVGNVDLTTGSLGTERRQVVGGAASVSLSLSSGDNLTITALGGRASLDGIVTLASDASIRNFDIVSSGTGIAANGINSATIDDVNVSSTSAQAFDFANTSGTVTLSNSTGTGLRVSGGNASYALNNFSITGTTTSRAFDVQSTTGGAITFDTNSSLTSDSAVLIDNIASDISFNGAVNVTAASGDAVRATNLGSATLAFNNGLTISNSNGRGLVASGGTVNVNTGSVSAIAGEAVDLDGVNAGITFSSLSATNSTDSGVDLNNVSGSFVVSGATTVTNASNAGVDISGGSGTKTFGAVTVNRQGTGINIDGGSSTLQFGQTSITNPGNVAFSAVSVANTSGGSVNFNNAAHTIDQGSGAADAISLSDNAASFSFDGGSVTTGTGASFAAVDISGAQAGVTFSNSNATSISQTGTGRLLDIDGVIGGNNILFANNGSLSATTAGNAGININNNAANVTVANTTINNSAADAVTVTGGTGQINLSNVDIDNAGDDGVQVAGLVGTVQFQQGSSVSNSAANGLNIDGSGGATVVQVFGTAGSNDFNTIGNDAIAVTNTTGTVTLSDVDGTAITGDVINAQNTGIVTITNGLTLASLANGRFSNQTGTIGITNSTLSNLAIDGGNATYTLTGTTLNNAGTGTSVLSVSNTTGGTVTIGTGNSITGNGAGIALSNVDGDVDISGSTLSLSNDARLSVTAGSSGNLSFGSLALNATGWTGTGIDLSGATGTVSFGDVDITNLGGITGVSTAGSSGAITMNSLDITGTGAASSKGVDITGSTGSLTVTNAGAIQNVITGIDLDSLGTGTTNSSLSYQSGTINAGVPVNTVGISAGSYNFTGTTITKNSALSTATGFGGDFLFVDATGGGTGTSTNRASADFAETNSSAGDIIVLVEDLSGNITATNGLQLKNNQQLIGFAVGPATVDFTGSNANVLGNFQFQVSDPTGNGSATLTNSGGTEVITLANSNTIRDFGITTSGAVDGIAGNGFTNTTLNNLALTNIGANTFDFTNAAGTVAITDSSATNSTGAGLRVNGGNATYAFNNFDVSDTATGRSLDISATTGGSLTFDANSAISNSGGSGVLINNIGGDVTFNGGVSVTGATSNAVTATNLNANTVNFNSSLGITAAAGSGLTASGGVLNIAGTGTTITATGGSTVDLSSVTVGNGSGGALTFANLTSGGGANGIALTNVIATNGLTITSSTLTNNTTAGINMNGVTGTLNIAAANIDANAAGTGVAITGVNGTINIGSGGTGLDIDGGTTGVSINQTSGTVNLGTGAGGVFSVDGTSGTGVTLAGAGTVNIGTGGGASSIGTTTDTGGSAFAATGGAVNANYAGSIVLASNVGLVSVQGGHSGTLTFSGALSNSAATSATQLDFNNADGIYNFDGTVSTDTSAGTGIGINIAATSGGTIDFDNTLTIATASGVAIQMAGTSGLDISGGSLDVDTTSGAGLSQSAGTVTLSDTTSIRTASTGTGISASGGTLSVASGAGTAEVISATGQGISLSGVTIGTGGVTFDTVNSGGGANGIALTNVTASNSLTITSSTLTNNTTAGINLNGVTGTLDIDAANIDANAAGTAVAVAGANGTLNIGTSGAGLDIDGGTTGVSINQTSGTVNLGTGAGGVFSVDGTSGTGVTLAGAGTVNIGTSGGSASIGATTTTTGTAIAVTGGNATFNFAGNIANTSGRLLDVQNTTGGSVTVTGTTITDSGTGILVQNAAGNVAITNAALTQSNATSVTLNGNSDTFTMTNGSITNTGAAGVAVKIDNTSGNIAFAGTTLGQTSGRLIDIGATTGATAGTISFSGGTLTSTSGTGVRVQNSAANVSLTSTSTFTSATTGAITLTSNTGSFTLNNSTISNTVGSAILGSTTSNLNFDNVTITDAATSTDAISLTNATGIVNLLNSSITYDAAAFDGLDIDNSALGAGTLTLNVDNSSFTGDTTATGLENGIDVVTSTGSTLNATATNNSFTNTYLDGIEIDVNGTGGGDSVTIGTAANGNTFTGVRGDLMDLLAQDNSTVSFDIHDNVADGNGLSTGDGIELFIGDGATSTINITNNTLNNIGNDMMYDNNINSDDIAIKLIIGLNATANSAVDITVSNNDLGVTTGNDARGLVVDVFGASTANVTANNNTFSSHLGNDGLSVVTATAGTETCVSASGNTFTGGDQIFLNEAADGSILRIPGVANAAALSAASGGVTVNTTGALGFNEACTIP